MGDLIGSPVQGKLYHLSESEFARIRKLPVDDLDRVRVLASVNRINTLYMIAKAGSGHIGSSFSGMEIMTLVRELIEAAEADGQPLPVFFSSKGHDAPALYSTLMTCGKLDYSLVHRLRRLNGLPGHPDVSVEPIETNTGSLGMGVSKAKGMVLAARHAGKSMEVFVLTGDGELQEGQFWESLPGAVNHNLHEINIIVDHNKLQSDTFVSEVSDLGDLEAKIRAFGYYVERCDGNDVAAVYAALGRMRAQKEKPSCLIADTIKGKGVSFMEHTAMDSDVEFYKFHSGAPGNEAYRDAVEELISNANALMRDLGQDELLFAQHDVQITPAAAVTDRLIPTYSQALLEQAKKNHKLVALDADLILDTGLIPFKARYPERFIECGIAEQDMVSMAGGMALKGLLPVVHSFGCFLAHRPVEQIYNNATEHTRIIYVASLSGIIPAGPGHSHQSVRDISTISSIPGMTVAEPANSAELVKLLDWAVRDAEGSAFLRLVRMTFTHPFDSPDVAIVPGHGVTVKPGQGKVIVTHGPIMLREAMQAAAMLDESLSANTAVIHMPWLNMFSADWIEQLTRDFDDILVLENHYSTGGIGDQLASAILSRGADGLRFRQLGLDRMPDCGTELEVLEAHGMNARSIANRFSQAQ
jgi:transketolase